MPRMTLDEVLADMETAFPETHKLGSALQVGDTIEVWWKPRRDTIVSLIPYNGPLNHVFPDGAQLASFAIGPGMTIENGMRYKILATTSAK